MKYILFLLSLYLVSCSNSASKNLSPINIDSKAVVSKQIPENESISIEFSEEAHLSYLNRTLNITNQAISTIGDTKFKLINLRFKQTSEHSFDNEYYDSELQLWHQNEKKENVIVSIFLAEGTENELLNPLIYNQEKAFNVNLNQILPNNKSFYSYEGSFTDLTQANYNQKVQWFLLTEPLFISANQLDHLKTVFGTKYKDIQKVNNREIEYVQDTSPLQSQMKSKILRAAETQHNLKELLNVRKQISENEISEIETEPQVIKIIEDANYQPTIQYETVKPIQREPQLIVNYPQTYHKRTVNNQESTQELPKIINTYDNSSFNYEGYSLPENYHLQNHYPQNQIQKAREIMINDLDNSILTSND